MKSFFLFATVLVAMSMTGCQTPPRTVEQDAGPAAQAGAFSVALGTEWKLAEVWIGGRNTGFNRRDLAAQGFNNAFTLEFDAEHINGIGAPNSYFAPFTLGQGNAVSIGVVAQTQMIALFEPEHLREDDYLSFIQNVYKWDFVGGRLELSSRDRGGQGVRLIFQR